MGTKYYEWKLSKATNTQTDSYEQAMEIYCLFRIIYICVSFQSSNYVVDRANEQKKTLLAAKFICPEHSKHFCFFSSSLVLYVCKSRDFS